MNGVFPQTFNANLLGKSFTEFSSEIVQTTHHEVVRRWFHSEHDAELFVWADLNKRILKQQFFCFGAVAEWNAVDGVRTGAVLYDETNPQEGEILHYDLKPQAATLRQASAVILKIDALDEAERERVCANFAPNSPLCGELGFGPQWMASLVRPGNRQSFFKRVVTRFKGWFKL